MDIKKTIDKDEITLTVKGRLDTSNCSQFEEAVKGALSETNNIVLDLKDLEYTSSSGLRVILSLQKEILKKEGSLTVRNVNSYIMEIFEVTGFTDILNIE